MRTVNDVEAIEKQMSCHTSKPNVVIVGSSFIGMESASVLSKSANVTVIGMEKVPFERVLGFKVGKAMDDLSRHYGINMEMEQFVEKYVAKEGGEVGGVVLRDGRRIDADFVILGAGVIPSTGFLKGSGIEVDKDCGITVSASMEVPGHEDVYAIGDVARYPYHLTNENVRVEHWNVAQNQGRLVAEIINLKIRDKLSLLPTFKHIPYFW
jgi:NADPH-dependent 2,4-dienoyl-CoA reductase/sulfur reductase-like enzyme